MQFGNRHSIPNKGHRVLGSSAKLSTQAVHSEGASCAETEGAAVPAGVPARQFCKAPSLPR